jgi:hypothetical protein
MSIEAMKQALEALLDTNASGVPAAHNDSAIEALNQAIEEAEKQEPHSWYSAQEDEWMTNKIRKEHERLNSYTHKVGEFDLALYTHPQPKRECDMGVMCIECPDAQPKCDPLTAEDFLDWYDSAIWGNEDFKECCRIAFEAGWQAAHGIKAD